MKKIFLSALLLTSLFFQVSAQNLPSYVPANGLVGWWPFNGNANDESGNNNNGTVNGATLTTDRFGNAGKAYLFDGASIISVNSNTDLCLQNQFTISFWVLRNNSNPMGFISKLRDPNGGGSYHISGDGGSLGVGINNDPGGCSTCNIASVGSSSNFNSWNHYVGIWDGIRLKFFQNSNLVSDVDGAMGNGNTLFNFNAPLVFGQYLSNYLNGSLDDIAIWNRALTQQEITALYQGANTTANCPTLPSNLQQGLVGYWPFCGNALDESGSGNHGTVNGATLTSDRFGNATSAYSFDGVDDFISCTSGGNSNLNIQSNLTISYWVKTLGQSPVGGNIISFGDNLFGTGGYLSYISPSPSSSISLFVSGNSWKELISSNLGDNSWHLNIIKLKDDSLFFFNDNQLQFITDSVSSPLSWNGLRAFGSRNDGLDGFFKGYLDDIAIWNRALSAEEISQLYQLQSCETPLVISLDTNQLLAAPGSSVQMQASANLDSCRYQWQSDAAGTGWNNLRNNDRYQGADSARLQVSAINLSNHLQQFRVIGSRAGCRDTSATVLLQVSDTCIVTDTNVVTLYDTSYVTVTDTLLIDITQIGSPAQTNTLKAYPNPTAGMLYINTGNFALMSGYSIRINSSAGQLVYEGPVNQALLQIPLADFASAGLFYLRVYNPSGGLVTTRKIVLQQ